MTVYGYGLKLPVSQHTNGKEIHYEQRSKTLVIIAFTLAAIRQDDGKAFAACQRLHSDDYCLSYINH